MYPDLQIEVARHYQRETRAQAHQQRRRRQSAARESRRCRAAQHQPGRPLRQALRLLTSGATGALRSAAGLTISPQFGFRGTYPKGHDHDVR